MSQQINKNLLKEALSNQYQDEKTQNSKTNDVQLANRDMVGLT